MQCENLGMKMDVPKRHDTKPLNEKMWCWNIGRKFINLYDELFPTCADESRVC